MPGPEAHKEYHAAHDDVWRKRQPSKKKRQVPAYHVLWKNGKPPLKWRLTGGALLVAVRLRSPPGSTDLLLHVEVASVKGGEKDEVASVRRCPLQDTPGQLNPGPPDASDLRTSSLILGTHPPFA